MKTIAGKIRLYVAAHSFLERFALIRAVHIPIMQAKGVDGGQMSIVFGAHEVSRIIASGYAGAFAQSKGAGRSIAVGIFLKAVSAFILLFGQSQQSMVMAGIIMGAGVAFMMSKIEPQIYHEIRKSSQIKEGTSGMADSGKKKRRKQSLFQEALFIRSLARQLGASLSGFALSLIYPIGGFFLVIFTTVFVIMFADAIIVLSVGGLFASSQDEVQPETNNKNNNPTPNATQKGGGAQNTSPLQAIKEALGAIKENKSFFWLLLFTASVASTSCLASDISRILMSKITTVQSFGKLYSVSHIMPILASAFMLTSKIGVRQSFAAKVAALGMLMFGILAAMSVKLGFVIAVAYFGISPILTVATTEHLSKAIPAKTLFTASGIVELMSSIINAVFFFTYGTLASIAGQKAGTAITMLLLGATIAASAIKGGVYRRWGKTA